MIKYVRKEGVELPVAIWTAMGYPYVVASVNLPTWKTLDDLSGKTNSDANSDAVSICERINSRKTTYPEAIQILFEAGFLQRIVTED